MMESSKDLFKPPRPDMVFWDGVEVGFGVNLCPSEASQVGCRISCSRFCEKRYDEC